MQSFLVLSCIALRLPANLNLCVGVACVVGEAEHERGAPVGETRTNSGE